MARKLLRILACASSNAPGTLNYENRNAPKCYFASKVATNPQIARNRPKARSGISAHFVSNDASEDVSVDMTDVRTGNSQIEFKVSARSGYGDAAHFACHDPTTGPMNSGRARQPRRLVR
jgi:hypothetical protein